MPNEILTNNDKIPKLINTLKIECTVVYLMCTVPYWIKKKRFRYRWTEHATYDRFPAPKTLTTKRQSAPIPGTDRQTNRRLLTELRGSVSAVKAQTGGCSSLSIWVKIWVNKRPKNQEKGHRNNSYTPCTPQHQLRAPFGSSVEKPVVYDFMMSCYWHKN